MYLADCAVQYFTEYGPSFDLDLMPGYVRNLNTETYTESIVSTILSMSCDTVLLFSMQFCIIIQFSSVQFNSIINQIMECRDTKIHRC